MSGGGCVDVKDPAIKLFGKSIPLADTVLPVTLYSISHLKGRRGNVVIKTAPECVNVEDSVNQEMPSVSCANKDFQKLDNKDDAQGNVDGNADSCNTSEGQVLKKPDKIIPCPRCNSLETKFCYFNNYNVNQPRHFCRNCQRYWTAGGTVRKVPVGAGRRKNKHLAAQFCQIMVPSAALAPTNDEIPGVVNQHVISRDESSTALEPLAGNSNFLKFRLEEPSCESMGTVNLGDQHGSADTCCMGENKEDPSQYGSSLTTSSVNGDGTHERGAGDGFLCYPVPWGASPLNHSTSSVLGAQFSAEQICDLEDSKFKNFNWPSPQVMVVPGLCSTSIPMQFVTAPYCGFSPYWPLGSRDVPFSEPCINFPTIAKHSRDEDSMEATTPKRRVIVPKTLRVNDPNYPLNSSVWKTLGINPCVTKPLESATTKSNDHPLSSLPELKANPAALCRWQTFQEST